MTASKVYREEPCVRCDSHEFYAKGGRCVKCVQQQNKRYDKDKRRDLDRLYAASPEGRAAKEKANTKWRNSPKGKESRARSQANEKANGWIGQQKHRKNNRPYFAAKAQERYVMKSCATPPWSDEQQIQELYTKAQELNNQWGTNLQVEHYYPIKGKTVSGLHCWDNLWLCDRELNNKKNNKHPDGTEWQRLSEAPTI